MSFNYTPEVMHIPCPCLLLLKENRYRGVVESWQENEVGYVPYPFIHIGCEVKDETRRIRNFPNGFVMMQLYKSRTWSAPRLALVIHNV